MKLRYHYLASFCVLVALQGPVPALAMELPEVELIERSGNSIQFASEAVGNQVVVISFTWGGCKTICPVADRAMAKLENRLKETGEQVRLLTITLDPENDTPRSLAARARGVGAGPDWFWLSGPLESVRMVLERLGAFVPDPAQHSPQFVVLNGATGWSTTLVGIPETERFLQATREASSSSATE